MEPKTITLRVPAIRNWKTTLAYGATALAWMLGHQSLIVAQVPPKYVPLANAAFGVGLAISGLLTKDAGNHASTPPPSV